MNLTRRGIVVAVAAVVSVVLGASFGARSLDVVAVPALAVLAFAVGQVALTDRPQVELTIPRPGAPGDARTIGIQVDMNAIATVTDRIDGVSPETVELAVNGDGSIEYDVTLSRRGVHAVGPLSVTVRDPLGLITERYQYTGFDPVVVYPETQRLTATAAFSSLTEAQGAIERQEFERLREYAPGESLRNVHWKTSAKHQDLFVVEHTRGGETGVSVVAESIAGENNADAMASAAASIICFLLEHDVSVDLTVPNGRLERGQINSRQPVLELLANASPGRVPTEHVESADVYVFGERGRATVEIDDDRIPFERLTDRNRTEHRPDGTAASVSTVGGVNS